MMYRPIFRRRKYGFPTYLNDIERMQRQMGDLLSAFFPNTAPAVAADFPAINVWTGPEGAIVTAELPGMKADDIDISVVGETVTLSGSRKPAEAGDDVTYHRQERGYGQFTRTFELPFSVEADKVDALFENGILQVSLPRAEADKPRKITVKTA